MPEWPGVGDDDGVVGQKLGQLAADAVWPHRQRVGRTGRFVLDTPIVQQLRRALHPCRCASRRADPAASSIWRSTVRASPSSDTLLG